MEKSESEMKDLYCQQIDLAKQKTGCMMIVLGISMIKLGRNDLQ